MAGVLCHVEIIMKWVPCGAGEIHFLRYCPLGAVETDLCIHRGVLDAACLGKRDVGKVLGALLELC